VAPPFKQAEFDIMFGAGINKMGEVLDMAVAEDLINKSGAWYSYGEERLGQGRENAVTYLKEHPEISAQLEERLHAKHGLKQAGAAEGAYEAED
jgi:recombination protein RecA